METYKASITTFNEVELIKIETPNGEIDIPISEDKANDVKSAFNKLVKLIKQGPFEIQLKEIKQDLFSQVANEYIIQLNREIQEVRGEIERYKIPT